MTLILPKAVLSRLLPLHIVLNAQGGVTHIGPALLKLVGSDPTNRASFLDLFSIDRPVLQKGALSLDKLTKRKLVLSLKSGAARRMTAVCFALPNGGFLVNMALGPGFHRILAQGKLTASDLAATDATLDMMYMLEMQSMVLQETKKLNTRLNGQRVAAQTEAELDRLTGLKNRRGLERYFAELANRGHGVIAMMMMDLDYFKSVNDAHGHAAGDAVLTEVAARLRACLRKNDFLARLGGDEFVLVIPDQEDEQMLETLSKRIVKDLKKPIHYQDVLCQIGVSIGIKLFKVRPGLNLDNAMLSTDAALYNAKQEGRGKVSFYREGGMEII